MSSRWVSGAGDVASSYWVVDEVTHHGHGPEALSGVAAVKRRGGDDGVNLLGLTRSAYLPWGRQQRWWDLQVVGLWERRIPTVSSHK